MDERAISSTATHWIRVWLLALGLMVYAMILIGGATRLTDSGLSITEWAPISGALPPLSEAAWIAEFEKYRETAEYQLQNRGMSLAEFQYIYWWEWGHRLFGRLIGLVAVGGLAVLAMNRWLNGRRLVQYSALIVLGGLQGAIGWWMVASGIGETTRIDVAPYRLAIHFTLALLIIGVVAWLWMDLRPRPIEGATRMQRHVAVALLVGVALQMAGGALVAGLDAGRTYTDWPMMAGQAFPDGYIDPMLGVRSLFEGREATQFNHRILAYGLFVAALGAAWAFRRSVLRADFWTLAALVSVQAVWGVLTLVSGAPLVLALLHQALGVVVFLAAVRLFARAWRSGQSSESVNMDGSTKTA